MRIKCDECGHIEPKREMTEALIGMPCPDCGADMMTRQDYDAGMKMFEVIKMLEALGLAKMVDGPTEGSIAINPHAGSLTITPSKLNRS